MLAIDASVPTSVGYNTFQSNVLLQLQYIFQ